jgi:hypothetical protein
MTRKLKNRERDALNAVVICFAVLVPIECLSTLIATYKFTSYPQFAGASKLVMFFAVAKETRFALLTSLFGAPVLLGGIIYFLSDLLPKKEAARPEKK